MIILNHLLPRLPIKGTPKSLFFSTTTISDFHLSLISPQDRAKAIASLLSNCTHVSQVQQIHAHILCSNLLQLYPVAFQWNNIIRAYTRHDSPLHALLVFKSMSSLHVFPDCYTLPIVLKSAAQIYDTQIGRNYHSAAVKLGLVNNEFCESGFINLYCKAGVFNDARKLFDENLDRKLGSWNSMIGGLAKGGEAREAMMMFLEMKKSGFEPDHVTMVSVTSACGALGNLGLALQLHKCVLQARCQGKPDIMMMNSLVDMYGKCGRMDLAHAVFGEMDQRNVSSWSSMIVGYATHGKTQAALEMFEQMTDSGVNPNHVTFIGVLTACVHGGLVQEGKRHFKELKEVYGLEPRLQHYGCLVDLLGRAGLLKEAKAVVEGMPMSPNVVIWGSLMGASEKFGDVKMGEMVALKLMELEPWNDGVYVVLANIYADRGLWDEAHRVRDMMKKRRLAKLPGYSFATEFD